MGSRDDDPIHLRIFKQPPVVGVPAGAPTLLGLGSSRFFVRRAGGDEANPGKLLGLIEKPSADLAAADHPKSNFVHANPLARPVSRPSLLPDRMGSRATSQGVGR